MPFDLTCFKGNAVSSKSVGSVYFKRFGAIVGPTSGHLIFPLNFSEIFQKNPFNTQ